MNGPNTRAYVKDNAVTRMIQRVAEHNAAEGKPAGRAFEQAGRFSRTIPAHVFNKMSPQQQARALAIPEGMTPQEFAMANARAGALGLTGDDDDDMPIMGSQQGEQSIEGVTDEEVEAMLQEAKIARPGAAPTQAAPAPTVTAPEVPRERTQFVTGLQHAPVPSGAAFSSKAMPDFRKVEGVNLIKGVVIVDGMEFPMAAVDVQDMKKYAVTVVLEHTVFQLAQALIEFGIPPEMAKEAAENLRKMTAKDAITPGGMPSGERSAGEEVQSVPANETTAPVQSRTEEQNGLGKSMQGLPEADTEALLLAESSTMLTEDAGVGAFTLGTPEEVSAGTDTGSESEGAGSIEETTGDGILPGGSTDSGEETTGST